MNPLYRSELAELYLGDALDVLPHIPTESSGLVVGRMVVDVGGTLVDADCVGGAS